MNVEILYQVILIFAGIGALMYGIKIMNGGVEASMGLKLKKILAKQAGKPFRNFVLGSGISFAVQNTMLTNILSTGLINVGTINLSQVIAICLGASFGASLSMVLLMFESVSIIKILSVLTFVGVMMILFSKTNKMKFISNVIFGFGLLCLGITMVGSGVGDLVKLVDLESVFLELTNPVVLIILGLVLTMIMQSSYPVVVILISFVSNNIMTFEGVCYTMLGSFIGSALSFALMISGFTEGANGRRIFIFNVGYRILIAILLALFMMIPNWVNFIHTNICGSIPSISVVMFNVFMCLCPVVLVPFTPLFSKLLTKLVKTRKVKSQGRFESFEISEKDLSNSVVAYSILKNNLKKLLDFELSLSKDMVDAFFSKEKYVEHQKTFQALSKAIRLTHNNLIKISGKFLGKDLEKIGILINILFNISQLSKENEHLENIYIESVREDKEIDESQKKFIIKLRDAVMEMGEVVSQGFDEKLTKRQKITHLQVVFKTNDILTDQRNQSKKALTKIDGVKDNSFYLNILYELENFQQEYLDIAIKLMLLEE